MKKLLASALLAAVLLLPMASRGEEPPDVVIITITIEVKQEMLPELMDAFARVFRRPEMVRNPTVGQTVTIIGGSNDNSSTITDGGNFKLSGNWTANLDDVLTLFVKAGNYYIEESRSDN